MQVHFGTLRSDGSEVAVKVACVGSKAKMLSDMRTMLRAAIVLRKLGLDGGAAAALPLRAGLRVRFTPARTARRARATARRTPPAHMRAPTLLPARARSYPLLVAKIQMTKKINPNRD